MMIKAALAALSSPLEVKVYMDSGLNKVPA
jgi:hypothetical protein